MDQDTPQASEMQFFTATSQAWDAMYRDCAAASRSIEFEQYILENDVIGKQFLQLFATKAAEGVQVNLILDGIGSRRTASSPLVQEIQNSGGKVHFYHRMQFLNLFFPSTWFPRNHTKTLIIDSRIAYVGSVCVADMMKDWRDTQVRVTGLLVKEIQQGFSYRWERFVHRREIFPHRFTDLRRAYRYVVHLPRHYPNPIYKELVERIRKSRRSVLLVTPYFLPPLGLRRALRRAAGRGVDVVVMMGEMTDVSLADSASHSHFPKYLRSGIRIFLYGKTILHAKYSIIDDEWATVGSTNMDYLSLLKNREGNIVITHKPTVAELRRHFEEDKRYCTEADMEYWNRKPLFHKLKGYCGRLVERML